MTPSSRFERLTQRMPPALPGDGYYPVAEIRFAILSIFCRIDSAVAIHWKGAASAALAAAIVGLSGGNQGDKWESASAVRRSFANRLSGAMAILTSWLRFHARL